MPIYIGNDSYVLLEDLYDPLGNAGAGEFITTGAVTAQLKDAAGTNIGSPIACAYYALFDNVAGHYWIGAIEEDLALSVNADVKVVASVAASGDRVATLTRTERVLERTS